MRDTFEMSSSQPLKKTRGLAESHVSGPLQRTTRKGTVPAEPSPVVKTFLENYHESHYYQVAKCARDLIEEKLRRRPELHVTVSFRAKKMESLKEKLEKRDAELHYKGKDDIYKDIHDLAGVRIILYTPSEDQREEVEKVIRSIWTDVKRKDHDGSEQRALEMAIAQIAQPQAHGPKSKKYRRRHPGYTAKHYRVKMEKHQDREAYTHTEQDRAEIQVVSALSHAWAEAGHDILYKSHEYGVPSAQEEQLLDSLNGLVMSGDILLEQFYDLVVKRTTARFQHHYDFGIYLRELDVLQPEEAGDERVEFDDTGLQVLLRFLVKIGKDRPCDVRDAFRRLGFPHQRDFDHYMKTEEIDPKFHPAPEMKAIICLLHHMLPPRSEDEIEEVPRRRQCYIMINALLLLQTFFGNSGLTNKFLQEDVIMSPKQRKNLHFMLTDTRRQLLLEDRAQALDHKIFEDRLKSNMKSAWEWFNQEACDEKSICGIAFRLAQMGATKDVEGTVLLGQLTIGPILPSPTSSSVDSNAEASGDESGDESDDASGSGSIAGERDA